MVGAEEDKPPVWLPGWACVPGRTPSPSESHPPGLVLTGSLFTSAVQTLTCWGLGLDHDSSRGHNSVPTCLPFRLRPRIHFLKCAFPIVHVLIFMLVVSNRNITEFGSWLLWLLSSPSAEIADEVRGGSTHVASRLPCGQLSVSPAQLT